jgi:CelD/BcsL family acetyltransferase involved in cellulose biosynthesis
MPTENLAFTIDAADSDAGKTAPLIEAQSDLAWPEDALPVTASPKLGMASAQEPETSSRSGIHLQVFRKLQEVSETWKAFERQADGSVFQSFAWLANWQRHIGARQGTEPAIVVGRDDAGELLFILPLAVERRFRRRRLTWLGAQLGDYNGSVLAPWFSDRVSADRFCLLWHDVVRLLRRDAQYRFDWVDLVKMPGSIGDQRNPFLDLGVRTHASSAYFTRLGRGWEEFYAQKRSPATRKRERRQLKGLAQYGEPRFTVIADAAEASRTMTALIEQKSRSFARMGVEDFLAKPGRREFFHAIVRDAGLREIVHLSRLDVGDQIAAASVGLRHGDCYHLILSSYQDGELCRFGPGRAHLNELLRHAIEGGFAAFDFTVGDEPYKRDWCDSEIEIYDYLKPTTPIGVVLTLALSAYRRGKRFVKRSPNLWRAFSKLRTIAALPRLAARMKRKRHPG